MQPAKKLSAQNGRPLTPTEIEHMVMKAEKEALVCNVQAFK